MPPMGESNSIACIFAKTNTSRFRGKAIQYGMKNGNGYIYIYIKTKNNCKPLLQVSADKGPPPYHKPRQLCTQSVSHAQNDPARGTK